jgi:hypothetical protein
MYMKKWYENNHDLLCIVLLMRYSNGGVVRHLMRPDFNPNPNPNIDMRVDGEVLQRYCSLAVT